MEVVFMDVYKSCQVIFKYNVEIINAIKTINGWSFDVACKKWYIPKPKMDELIEKLENMGFRTIICNRLANTENVSKRSIEEEPKSVKKPFSLNNQHTIKASKYSNFITIHLPIPNYAYNVIKSLPNMIHEKNSWIIKSDIQEEFFKLCKDMNITIEYLNNF